MRGALDHNAKISVFENDLKTALMHCLQVCHLSEKIGRERIWSAYHQLRSSDAFKAQWDTFLKQIGCPCSSRIAIQYISNFIFKKLLISHHPVDSTIPDIDHQNLTYEEVNGLRYAAGWVSRTLKKELKKSGHPLKDNLQLCLWDLLDDGDEDEQQNDSKDWVDEINCGGLTRINNITFELFSAMEIALRKQIRTKYIKQFTAETKHTIIKDDNVKFLWCIISADWEDECADTLIETIVQQWVKIRGFSYASACVEMFKTVQRKTLEKSKGLRKQLLPTSKAKRSKL